MKCNLAGIVGACLASVLLAGCTQSVDPAEAVARVNASNIQRLANLYLTYQMKHNWRGPANEKVFKDFIRGFNAEKLARIGIDPSAVDGLFVSERDGQPFQIRYGVVGSSRGSSEPVVFEAAGEGGSRLVAFLNMEQREVSQGEYDSLWSGSASSPKP